jgi:hypoxanthine-DNA glycosylase
MHAVRCFPPIARRDARVLILGSMPGAASLAAGQYYAHPRNAFWPILGDLLGFDPAAPYRKRVQALKNARIAVWDVLHGCVRAGSLDSAIERDSEIANDFATFFRRHPRIAHVFFNGARAEQAFRRHALPGLGAAGLRFARLPSTSPAHAARSLPQKRAAWRAGLGGGRVIL